MACDPSILFNRAKLMQKLPGFEEEVITYLLCQWANSVTPSGDFRITGAGDFRTTDSGDFRTWIA